MTKIQNSATVHPKTVTEFSEGQHSPIYRYKTRRQKTDSFYIKVDERVWKVVLKLSGGDVRRCQVVNSQEVIIHNNPNWRQYR